MMDKSPGITVFEMKQIRKDFSYKIAAADVFNSFLYVGDQKGNIYSYPIRVNDPEIIAKSTNQTMKSITKSKIDKLLCYPSKQSIVALSDQKLFVVDTGLRKPQQIAVKIYDFAINESYIKEEGAIHSIVAITKKKEGSIFYYNPTENRFVQSKKFPISDLPTHIGYTGNFIILSYKKDYEVLNIDKNFALKKGTIVAKSPFFKITNLNEVLYFMDDIGIFMDPEFTPKTKDPIPISRPIVNITMGGNYCFVLCDNFLQIYTTFDPKKYTLVQQMALNGIKGITSDNPFVFSREEMFYLFQIPYETQIKGLLQRCKVDEALNLLIQNVGPDNQQKITELKMNAVWPLLRKMQFDKAKQILKTINFDIREIILLYPELIGLQIESLRTSKAEKYMSTMIIEALNQKSNRTNNDEAELKKKSKLFLKEILQFKREYYIAKSSMSKVKIPFETSKYSLIKPKLPPATSEQLLEIIDFCLIKWFLDMGMYRHLEEFFLNNPNIYCKRLFGEFESQIKNNAKLVQFPTLKPRLYAAFDRYQEAYESWKVVAESNQKDPMINIACEESVKLLTQFEDKQEIIKKLTWILKKKPQIGMSFFSKVDLKFIQPDEVIRTFEQMKEDKYLQLYLEIIVIQKKTEIQSYHTKLLLLYIDNLFKIHPKESKQEGKTAEFLQKLAKMRKFQRSPDAKYASEPILKKIQKCEWLFEDQVYLYSRQKRHEEALKKYINKNMYPQAQLYCKMNKDNTLTIYFKMMLAIYKSYETSKNNSSLLLKKDIIIFLRKYSSNSQLDPITVLELIPQNWMLNDSQGIGGIYQFLESAIGHTLHEKRATQTSRHLSEMDLLNVQYNLIQAKRAYLRFTYKKKCCICGTPISDKYFVVYPNANVCHQACVKKQKNTICPVTKQDFQKTFKY